ncbi:hypothetical protein EV182_001386 [Spiromyces aspiralis]|uniref:Uncharacterized protein n=1 Tax=Spiromyces aspiralis TaxID=68401 RepID=A0ACC1HI09_9FUNG|nr:hypothetical protein EV182_001386 [Spiromyces aspiralis]
MTSSLPPDLLPYFEPRPPLDYAPPLDREPTERTGPTITGISVFINQFNQADDPNYKYTETIALRKAREREEREKKAKQDIERGLKQWNPHEGPNATEDPYRTIIVSRLNYDVTEKELKREFEAYGDIKSAKYEHERSVKDAYEYADGIKILGRRIVVDVERGRTVRDWRPRRLGTRIGPKALNQKKPGRFDPKNPVQSAPTRGTGRYVGGGGGGGGIGGGVGGGGRPRGREWSYRSGGGGGRNRDHDRVHDRHRDRHRDYERDRGRDYDYRDRNGSSRRRSRSPNHYRGSRRSRSRDSDHHRSSRHDSSRRHYY